MFNQVVLIGRMTKDPDLRFTPEGNAVSNFTLALNRTFKNADGEYDADFVNCIVWRKTAEITADFCQKGSLVGVSGRIQSRNFENKEGKRIYITEVVVDNIRFLNKKKDAGVDESLKNFGKETAGHLG